MGNHRFLVHAPPKWREQALGKGYVLLGEVSIRVFRTDSVFSQGLDPVQVWVKITDLWVCVIGRRSLIWYMSLLQCLSVMSGLFVVRTYLGVGCYWRLLILRLYLLINGLNTLSGPMSRKSFKSFFLLIKFYLGSLPQG
jgi:hypothetical protein